MNLHKSLRSLIASAVGVTVKIPAAYDIAGGYETVADWSRVYPKPRIVIHKATEGTYYSDPKLYNDFAGMLANGIRRGCYHFHRKAYGAIAQAQYFCNFIRGTIKQADKLILDMEEGNETPGQIIAWLDEVERQFPNNEIIIYSRKNLLDPLTAQCTAAQLTRLKKYRLWIAGYPLYPDLYDSIPSGYVPANLGKVIMWQYSENGTVSGISGEVDLDWLDPAFAAELGEVPQVEHTQPAPGIDEYIEVVNGVRCHVSLIDMTNKTLHVRHFPGGLGYVSQVAPGSLAAFNGIDYNKQIAPPIPYGPAYTAGVAANSLNPEFRYFLNISKTNIFTFTYRNFTDFYNTTSFVRPLVIDGNMAPDIRDNPNKIEYTEIHACAAFGYCKDGRLIQVAAEGKVNPSTGAAYEGITVPQLVNLILKYGGQNVGQHGGGGDVSKAINGTIVTSFSDPQERAVAQVIYITGTGDTMDGIAKEKLGNQTRVRKTPSRYGVIVTTLNAWEQVNFTQKVPVEPEGANDRTNEMWLQLTDGNFVNYKLYNTAGVLTEMFAIVQEPSVTPPPSVDVVITTTVNVTTKTVHVDKPQDWTIG